MRVAVVRPVLSTTSRFLPALPSTFQGPNGNKPSQTRCSSRLSCATPCKLLQMISNFKIATSRRNPTTCSCSSIRYGTIHKTQLELLPAQSRLFATAYTASDMQNLSAKQLRP